MEEKVLLLVRARSVLALTLQTKSALYVVSFNYSLEKVVGFTRIPLTSIKSMQKGEFRPANVPASD